jgi:hypothetical protein
MVVRGTYSPGGTVGWNGMVLVIGQGNVQGTGGGNNSYNGAVFVAQTRDASGNLLNNLGVPHSIGAAEAEMKFLITDTNAVVMNPSLFLTRQRD